MSKFSKSVVIAFAAAAAVGAAALPASAADESGSVRITGVVIDGVRITDDTGSVRITGDTTDNRDM